MMRHFGMPMFSLALVACAASITPMTPNVPVAAPEASAGGTVPPTAPATPLPAPGNARSGQLDQPVRIGLAFGQPSVRIGGSGNWNLYDRTGERLIGRSRGGDVWTVESDGDGLRLTSVDGETPPTITGPLVARPEDDNTLLSYGGKRYRGELLVMRTDSGLTVINRLSVESYLRGVVPLEIGTDRNRTEEAAVEAQAVAARSYTYTRLDDRRPYDMLATVIDQVYGGADAERPVADAAILATRDLVLLYNGKVINAPYHANSGGRTAAASEVWRSADEPYLVSVSDQIPGTDHFYCEESPKFRWTRTFDAAALSATLDRYLRKYSNAPSGSVGAVRSVSEGGRTPSGRLASIIFDTDRGRYSVRGNDIRFVLRSAGGDVLPSTMFTIDASTDGAGHVSRLTLSGTGNGHGVGMDQWGAIARARAGQDYVTILRTYYPGTMVGRIS